MSRLCQIVETLVERPERQLLCCLIRQRLLSVSDTFRLFDQALQSIVSFLRFGKYGAVQSLLNLFDFLALDIFAVDDMAVVLCHKLAQRLVCPPRNQFLVQAFQQRRTSIHLNHLLHQARHRRATNAAHCVVTSCHVLWLLDAVIRTQLVLERLREFCHLFRREEAADIDLDVVVAPAAIIDISRRKLHAMALGRRPVARLELTVADVESRARLD